MNITLPCWNWSTIRRTSFRSVHVYGALADLELRQGRLRKAEAYWRKALAVIENRNTWGQFPLPLIGWVYIRIAEIQYEWNELQEVSDLLARGLERAELGGDMRALIAGYLLTARLKAGSRRGRGDGRIP